MSTSPCHLLLFVLGILSLFDDFDMAMWICYATFSIGWLLGGVVVYPFVKARGALLSRL